MLPFFRRLPVKLAFLGTGLTLLAVAADGFGILERIENLIYDDRAAYCQYFAPPPSPDIVHLDIDDASIESIGNWPWPRATMAELMDEIERAGPKVVDFDILYIDPSKPEWVPASQTDGSGGMTKIDHDEVLAASMQRAGNVLLPVHLGIVKAPVLSPLERDARQLLLDDLEMDEKQAVATLASRGAPDALARAAFISARRSAALAGVAKVWDQINPDQASIDAEVVSEAAGPSSAASQPAATSQPTMLSTGDAPICLPSAGPLEQRVILKLLTHSDLSISSPLLRAVDEAYHQVRAERVLRKLSFPIPKSLPPLVQSPDVAIPLPELSRNAVATGFVDYPDSRDGKVRAVPLFVQYDGRMYPQMGLMVASLMLGVSPADFRYSENAITIPLAGRYDAKGNMRQDIVIPMRTYRSPLLDQPIPTYFDIPWIGGRDWKSMYDPAHPGLQKQHVTMNAVHDVCEMRRNITRDNQQIDKLLGLILHITNEPSIQTFLDHAPPAEVPLSRHAVVESTLKVLAGLGIPLDKSPTDPDLTSDERVLFRAIAAMKAADSGGVRLSDELNRQQSMLQTQLQGKAVLVGSVATGHDLKPTSIHNAAPGVIVHGTIANAILTGRLWRPAPEWVTVLVTLGLGLLITVLTAWMTPSRALLSAVTLAVGYLLVNGLVLFDYGNIIVGAAGPVAAITGAWCGCTLLRLVAERVERARITRRFRSYVDPSLVNWVEEHPEQARFDGEKREMTMAFSDLAGFTSMTEQLGERVIPIIAEYMSQMVPAIRANNGFVAQLMGDGIYFFFGAPKPDPNHALHAMHAVCDMRANLDMLNASFRKRGLPMLGMRIGVTTGPVVIGDAGPLERSDYTAIGNDVNLAARLESANKFFGTLTLVSGRTVELLKESFLVRPVANLQVAGRSQGVLVYEPLCPIEVATPEQHRLVEYTSKVVTTYQQGDFEACIDAAERLERELEQSRKLANLYRTLALRHRAERPEKFDGLVVLTEK